MGKTDDFVKDLLLSRIDNTVNLKHRVFRGGSRRDQELWVDGGLTFGFSGHEYGSCDFAWYYDGEWKDPYTGRTCNARPVIVVEATDCLNTRSWGNAQIQRFHHAYGAALCGLTAVYYLNKGEHEIRPYLLAAGYYATRYLKGKSKGSRYLITDDLGSLNSIVTMADKAGIDSKGFTDECGKIEDEMLRRFNSVFTSPRYVGDWNRYLASRDAHHTPSGWVKILGPDKENITEASKRMGHIVIGEALTTQFLLYASGKLAQNETFFYLLPLMSKRDIEALDASKAGDKEWSLVRKNDNPWRVLALDELSGISPDTRALFESLKGTNRNINRSELNRAKRMLVNELMSGRASIPAGAGQKRQLSNYY